MSVDTGLPVALRDIAQKMSSYESKNSEVTKQYQALESKMSEMKTSFTIQEEQTNSVYKLWIRKLLDMKSGIEAMDCVSRVARSSAICAGKSPNCKKKKKLLN